MLFRCTDSSLFTKHLSLTGDGLQNLLLLHQLLFEEITVGGHFPTGIKGSLCVGISSNDEMARNLRHRGRRKRRRDSLYSSRGIIQDRVDISLRPSVVDEKKRFGDFEIDTMIGKNRRGAIMTTNDRCRIWC